MEDEEEAALPAFFEMRSILIKQASTPEPAYTPEPLPAQEIYEEILVMESIL